MSRRATDRARRTRGWAVAAFGAVVALTVAGLVLVWLGRGLPPLASDPQPSFAVTVADAVLWLGVPAIGALAVWVRPSSRLGWLFLLLGVGFPLERAAGGWTRLALSGTLPWVTEAGWLGSWVWMLQVAFPLALLHFPDGQRLAGRTWRAVTAVAWVIAGVAVLGMAILPARVGVATNPVAVPGVPAAVRDAAPGVGFAAFLGLMVLAVVSLVVRYRRAHRQQRLQLLWMLWGVIVFMLTLTATDLLLNGPLHVTPTADAIVSIFISTIPTLAIGVALFRHQLWDIERLFDRTVTYALVLGVLLAVYAGAVVGLQAVLAPMTGSSDLAVAGSTLAVAGLFGPVRRRIQSAVNRRFHRRRYDAIRTVEMFGQSMRTAFDLDELRLQLRDAVERTVAPASQSFWLVPRDMAPAVRAIQGEPSPHEDGDERTPNPSPLRGAPDS